LVVRGWDSGNSNRARKFVMKLESSDPPMDIDAEQFGNEMRYINSCKVMNDANAKLVEVCSPDGLHVLVYTTRPVSKGQEILADFAAQPATSKSNGVSKTVKRELVKVNGNHANVLAECTFTLPEISASTIKVNRNLQSIERQPSTSVFRGYYYLTPVAIKDWNGDLESFKAECKALSQYRHPNIVSAYGYTAAKNAQSFAVVLELAELGTFDAWVSQYKDYIYEFNLVRYFVQIAKDVASAFSYLQDLRKPLNRLIQGSLKPINVWLFGVDILLHGELQFANLRAKIADMAEREESPFLEQRSVWVAPEYLTTKTFDLKGDVYSFGLICCFYWSKGKNPITPGVPPHVPDVCPEKWKELLRRCLNLDPITRPSFSEILASLKEIEDQCSSLINQAFC